MQHSGRASASPSSTPAPHRVRPSASRASEAAPNQDRTSASVWSALLQKPPKHENKEYASRPQAWACVALSLFVSAEYIKIYVRLNCFRDRLLERIAPPRHHIRRGERLTSDLRHSPSCGQRRMRRGERELRV